MENMKGVTQTKQLSPLQWQLMMKCWKMNLRPGQYSWWGPTAWRGRLNPATWLYKLRQAQRSELHLPAADVLRCALRKTP
ncbi:MAG: hypothetical protein WKF84_14210 [Pyrinomonadaceae bacterium]